MPLTRRKLLRNASLATAGSLLFRATGESQVAAEPAKRPVAVAAAAPKAPLAPFNRFPRAVQEYYVQLIRAVEREADARRAALRTKADAERYVADVREKIRRCFGPFPDKTPLNARVTATHRRDGYTVENVIFDSRPNFPVTANLYVPSGRSRPMPGVIGTCGHSSNGKAAVPYQSFAQGLARQGYVVLIFDPMGQGERLQHTTPSLTPSHGSGTVEHIYVGNRMSLVDENQPSWFVWDGIRALDYLLTRPEVDSRHVGVTGNSGGGTQATWLCGVEPRFTMAAPSCFVTTLRRNIENEESQDAEQYPWHMLALGLDHSDFIAAMAPKPVRILGQERDYFDARGFEEAAGRLKHLYTLLGAEDNFSSFLGPDPHGFHLANREAMYGWFNRQTGVASGQKEPALKLEKDEILRCTGRGQIAEKPFHSAFDDVREKSQRLAKSRKTLRGQELKDAVADALKLPPREGIADYRIMRSQGKRDYITEHSGNYILETEPGISVLGIRLSELPLLSRVPRGFERALLYVAHRTADGELRNDAWLRDFLKEEPKGTALFACEPRGIGDSEPQLSTPKFAGKGGIDYFHSGLGLMFDRPMAGQRTFDVLRVLDWLQANGHREIHLVARGEGAIPGSFAALLHEGVRQVTLRHALRSYSDVAESETYRWPLSSFVPAALTRFDLPDIYRELESKGLRQIDPAAADAVASNV
ncbi:MAG: acetylxylan esterase [Opitutaceae bacterium]|nr:acetylxylan esterase [Opitutaceae bacterium]